MRYCITQPVSQAAASIAFPGTNQRRLYLCIYTSTELLNPELHTAPKGPLRLPASSLESILLPAAQGHTGFVVDPRSPSSSSPGNTLVIVRRTQTRQEAAGNESPESIRSLLVTSSQPGHSRGAVTGEGSIPDQEEDSPNMS